MYKVTVFSHDGDHYKKEFDKLDAAYEELDKAEEYYKKGGFQRQILGYPIDTRPPIVTERVMEKQIYGNLWCRVHLSIENMDYKQYERSKNTKTPW